MQPAFEMADVLQAHLPAVQDGGRFNTWQLRTLDAVKRCRTASLGSHIDGCTSCGQLRISYNSCRNRHCPKCQGTAREKWIQAREEEVLPVPYFHVVFTLPDTLNKLCLYKPKVLYDLLFRTAWSVLNTFGKDHKWLGAQTGMISILHTWGQTITLHPHLHCIVPGGGLTKRGKWKTARTGPQSVVEYLGRYTHKIAMSNHRIQNIENGKVIFSYKDYKHGSVKKSMSVEGIEFIRRYGHHILQKGFVRIRHYGICSSGSKVKSALVIKAQLPLQMARPFGVTTKAAPEPYNSLQCPCCKKEAMETLMRFNRRGPPANWKELATDLLAAMKALNIETV
jgi:hypothetical protein